MLTRSAAHNAYDVVIVGAGPAGAATALALLQRGARVALIERRAQPEDRMGESLRGIASEMLRELGVWHAFQKLEQRPSYLHRSAWGGEQSERPALRMHYGPDLHLDRARFDALLIDSAVARGAVLFRPATVRELESVSGGVRLALACDGARVELNASKVVDATGRGAGIALRFGAVRRHADRLIGVARSFDRGAREPATLIEAADDGWWYSAPLPGGRMVALFVTDGDSPARDARRADTWPRYVASAPRTRALLTGIENARAPRSYLAAPASLDWEATRPMLPVGDAALCFDPIAADGLCFALRSGIEAASALFNERGGPHAYRAGVHAIYRNHLERRELLYAAERRLRPTPFWQRSRAAPVASSR